MGLFSIGGLMNVDKRDRIFVAGHNGLVGSAIVRQLEKQGFTNIFLKNRSAVDLSITEEVNELFFDFMPDYVFLAAARVGGILDNSKYQADFILENLRIQQNVMESALHAKVKKLVFFGSSCIYPKFAPQPIKEESLLTGMLEQTNYAYAVAKIAGVHTAQAIYQQHGIPFISIMPPSLYGPNDNYDLNRCHVLPALIRRFHEGKIFNSPKVTLWGDGTALRELLYSDDLANAAVFCLEHYDENKIINVGSNSEISVRDLAHLIRDIVGYRGDIEWDVRMPGGTPRKLLDSSRINAMGWKATTQLEDGIEYAYQDFLKRHG